MLKRPIKTVIRKFFAISDRLMGIIDHGRHTFIGSWLNDESVVIDLGCSEARISHFIADTFSCRVIAVEASPVLCESISLADGMSKLNYAMADKDGETVFYHSDLPATGNIITAKPDSSGREFVVPSRSLESLLDEINVAEIDLIKVDIEGSEVDMLCATERSVLNRFKQLNVEFHDRIRYPSTTPEETARTIAWLRNSGFVGFDLGWNGWNWLFIRKDLLTSKHASYLWFRSLFRNTLGANY